jgi:formamidopyrimidine-DNA glycosylase
MREATDSHQVRQPRAVHARGGKSCPRCFSVMRVRPQGEQGRLTYWCPRCQSMDA